MDKKILGFLITWIIATLVIFAIDYFIRGFNIIFITMYLVVSLIIIVYRIYKYNKTKI